MKIIVPIILLFLVFMSCEEPREISSVNPENWSKRIAKINVNDSLEYGKSYLSLYSQIYSVSDEQTTNLTAMVSMRNTSDLDTIFILKAEYYDTHGKPIRKYFDDPIYLAPLETAEIIIDEVDVTGGTGANFIFEWQISKNSSVPLFEGIMSSGIGRNGLSFITQSVRIK